MPSLTLNNKRPPCCIQVRALFNFAGKNNDELCFKRSDIITLTQNPDEGWWEGTLDGKTGWFPSDYVELLESNNSRDTNISEDDKNEYQRETVENLLNYEESHVSELKQLIDRYLLPLESRQILNTKDYRQLLSNIVDILQHHSNLLKSLTLANTDQKSTSNDDYRIGGAFLKFASVLKSALSIYCENHPYVVKILTSNKDALSRYMMDSNSNFTTLVTGLSSPFRHIDKYPNLLQEIERHLQENHPDRGDTQRAVSVYRDLANSCNDIRKQKEGQMELLSCIIKDWTGPPLTSFGEILYTRSVSISYDNEVEWKEKFLALFARLLLVLNVSSDMNSYIFERKIDLSATSVRKTPKNVSCPLSSHQNVLTISGKQGSEIILKLSLSSYEETNKWLHNLGKAGVYVEESNNSSNSNGIISAKACSSVQNHQLPQSQKLEFSLMPSPGYAEMISKRTCSLSNVHSLATSDNSSKCLPPSLVKAKNQFTLDSSYQLQKATNLPPKKFSGFCIRPLPPHKLYNVRSATESNQIKMRKKESVPLLEQEEADILRVVEAYCLSAVPPAVKGGSQRKQSESPHLLIAEDEKLLIEDWVEDELVIKERTLVDTVYSLKDEVNGIKQDLKKMMAFFEEERAARLKSDELLRKLLQSNLPKTSNQCIPNSANIPERRSDENTHSESSATTSSSNAK